MQTSQTTHAPIVQEKSKKQPWSHNTNEDITTSAAAFDAWFETCTPFEQAALNQALINATQSLPQIGPAQAKHLIVCTLDLLRDHVIRP
jgi:hypothetical protein